LATRRVTAARVVGPTGGGPRTRRAQLGDEPCHVLGVGPELGSRGRGGGERFYVPGVGTELGIGGSDGGLEPHHQNSDRRAWRPCAIISAIRSFTRSTLSAMISSSSFGLPSNRIGSPRGW